MAKAFYIGGGLLLIFVFPILAAIIVYIRRSERRRSDLFREMGLMAEGEDSQERWPL